MLVLAFDSNVARANDLPPGVRVGEYDAPAVGRRLHYTVLLPDGYDGSQRRYPVLYLLHGFSGNHTSWLTYAGLPPGSATEFGMIIVLPDAGNTCYANWLGAEDTARPQRWEDAIADDLVAHVDATFRTVARREGRAIGGLSAGGYGAVVIGLHRPERFCAVVSSAGALRLAERAREELRPGGKPDWNSPRTWEREDARPPVPGSPGFATQDERTPAGLIFTTAAQADAADPFRLLPAAAADKRQLPHFHLDCGTETAAGKKRAPSPTCSGENGSRIPCWKCPAATRCPTGKTPSATPCPSSATASAPPRRSRRSPPPELPSSHEEETARCQ